MTVSDVLIQPSLPIMEVSSELPSGIWPAQKIKAAIERGDIKGREPIDKRQIQPASLDLRLGHTAFRVPASFLPGPRTSVIEKVRLLSEEEIPLDLADGAVLHKGKVYIIPLLEYLRLKRRTSAHANPKSSTGRLDVFARVITDGGKEFDSIPEGYKGPLWLEVAPRSFNVRVRTGTRLAQVRVKRGTPPSNSAFLRRINDTETLVRPESGVADTRDATIAVTVDVSGDPVTGLIGYKAKATNHPIDMDLVNHYDPEDYWQPIYRPDRLGITLSPDDFHILASKELIAIPTDCAADMIAYDTLVGEFRVHYAGFFDPGFGYSVERAEGTRAVLEVRSHEVPFMVEDGQVVGRLLFERLTEPTDKPYGAGIGSAYQRQGLTLSKQFKRTGY